MSSWSNHGQRTQNQGPFRKFILIALSAGAIFSLLAFSLLFYLVITVVSNPQVDEEGLAELSALPNGGNAVLTRIPEELEEQSVVAAVPYTPATVRSFAIPEDRFIDALSNNLTEQKAPPLKHDNEPQKKGPKQVDFSVSANGRSHSHSIGRATSAQTDIIGAAAEWKIRPWWRPGWINQTVDCGEDGTVAIGGHVSWGSKPGPFYDLGAMTAGDEIRCLSSDNIWYRYRVSEVVRIDYNETDYYWQSRPELNSKQLTLFSCTPEITGIIVVRAEIVTEAATSN